MVSVTFAYFLVPETKGLSLEQVDRMLEEVNPRNSRGWVPHTTFAAEMGFVNKGTIVTESGHPTEVKTHEVQTSDATPATHTKEVV